MKKIQLTMTRQPQAKLIEVAFEEFIRSCRVKNLSDQTLRYYNNYMKDFQKFLDLQQITSTSEINSTLIENYTLYLKGLGTQNDITINTSLRAVRAIVYYFQGLGYTETFKINLIKADDVSKEPFTHHELKLLLAKPKTKSFTEYRNWVIVNFLLGTGVRVGELVSIQIKDINIEEAIVKIKRGKSRRERYIPLGHNLMKVIDEYLRIRQYRSLDSFLFCNIYSERFNEDAVKHAISKYCLKRGINKTSCHLFRHTFAKEYILNGGDIFRLQKILGHRSLDIVKKYVNMYSRDLQKDFDMLSPLEKLSSPHPEPIRLSKI